MKSNLTIRFLVIIAVTLISSLIAYFIPPQLGIDLAGGTSLLYELDLTKAPKATNESNAQLAARVVEVLKKRVDPLGQKNIIWRVVGDKRIQIQMPYPPKATLDARARQEEAFKALQDASWKQAEVEASARKKGTEREEAFKKLASATVIGADRKPQSTQLNEAAYQKLEAMAKASDLLAEAQQKFQDYKPATQPAVPATTQAAATTQAGATAPATGPESATASAPATATAPAAPRIDPEQEKLLAALYDAQENYNAARAAAMDQSVDPSALKTLVDNADDPLNKDARELRDATPAKYPLQGALIKAYIDAHLALTGLSGGGVDSPEELQRLVTKAGVLDFRIAVRDYGGDINVVERQEAILSLQQKGADQQVDVGGTKARWFQVDKNGKDNFRGGYVTGILYGQQYVLCYDNHDQTLTHSDPARKQWSVSARDPYNDPSQGGWVMPFSLDPVGAGYMGQLTGDNINRPMAILLDDKAMSAPNIHSKISDSGVITFGTPSASHSSLAIQKEAEQLKAIMDAGSLPATLQSEPISVENISPDMGSDNITAGLVSSFIAVLAVVFFMLAYYTITGFFADVALMLNLVLVLATMAMVKGTFTLPGIAGLVLTLGMAVDANVLINERIREEVHRGASLWMAIKQGYDRVFWTVFDSNLTTALTSVVLIFVGSEEVKGFGVTLLIGLVIQLFTALFVTRTFMMAFVQWGLIKAIDDHSVAEYLKEIVTFSWLRNGHWPFMKVITVSNIDWIGKRKIFWGVSAVITIAGLAAFMLRGEDKYDIEFRGGTQVTFQLKSDMSVDEVRSTVQGLAKTSLSLKDLGDARVYTIGKPEDHRFQMQTTIANKSQNFEATLPAPLKAALGADIKPDTVTFRQDSGGTTVEMALAPLPGGGFATPATVQEKVRGLASRPEFTDLHAAVVQPYGKPSDHLLQVRIPNQNIRVTLLEPLANAFKGSLEIKPKLAARYFEEGKEDQTSSADLSMMEKEMEDAGYLVPVTESSLDEVFAKTSIKGLPTRDVTRYRGGVAIMLDDLRGQNDATPPSAEKLYARVKNTRQGADFNDVPNRDFTIIPITVLDASGKKVAAEENDKRPMVQGVLLTADSAIPYDAANDNQISQWRSRVATSELRIIRTTLASQELFEGVTSFDAVVASQAKIQALVAIIISLLLIVVYVWVRFGGLMYGLGAILSLAHDATVALAATVLSGVVYNYVFHGHSYLLITDFKINLTMIAAYLTVIGYSVNDTIVIFDRVREMRGRSHIPLTKKLVNDAINQCFGRTIWTTFTVFIVVLIMYIWGGEGVRGFSFAMLIGVFTGAYSTLAIASPMLLTTGAGGASGDRGPNPFTRKQAASSKS